MNESPMTFTVEQNRFSEPAKLRLFVGPTPYRTEYHEDYETAYNTGETTYGATYVAEEPTEKKEIFVLTSRRFLGGSACGQMTDPLTRGIFTSYEKAQEFQDAFMRRWPQMSQFTTFTISPETLDPEFTE